MGGPCLFYLSIVGPLKKAGEKGGVYRLGKGDVLGGGGPEARKRRCSKLAREKKYG